MQSGLKKIGFASGGAEVQQGVYCRHPRKEQKPDLSPNFVPAWTMWRRWGAAAQAVWWNFFHLSAFGLLPFFINSINRWAAAISEASRWFSSHTRSLHPLRSTPLSLPYSNTLPSASCLGGRKTIRPEVTWRSVLYMYAHTGRVGTIKREKQTGIWIPGAVS